MRPDHLFVSSTDGCLYDTRDPQWSKKPALRDQYQRTYARIVCAAQVKASLRAGPYAWPGGYQMYFVLADGAALSFEGCRKELKWVLADTDAGDGQWNVVGVEINYEDVDLCCESTGERIPAAYGKED